MKPMKQCNHAGCRKLIPYDVRYCNKHTKELNKYRYHKRVYASNESQYQQFYKSAQWHRLSRRFLQDNVVCVECYKHGIIRPSQIADHVIELKDDWTRRLDITNLQPLCRACHNKKTANEKHKREQKS